MPVGVDLHAAVPARLRRARHRGALRGAALLGDAVTRVVVALATATTTTGRGACVLRQQLRDRALTRMIGV
ncbi:MAG: hypothetical protein ABS81_29945 [Pseudonocardia sp. SCN 72-86]|nr:MAG: hypothetical protein ABS81_29945 [Pseudonocardia sp. SCN 72-86]